MLNIPIEKLGYKYTLHVASLGVAETILNLWILATNKIFQSFKVWKKIRKHIFLNVKKH